MQKIREEKGITLTILVITIIILLILIQVSLDLGFDSVDSVKDSKVKSELQLVGQATISEYTKAKQLNYLIDDGITIPANFVGEEITGQGMNTLPSLPSETWALNESDAVGYKSYFRLTPEDLDKLYITNVTDVYIINYYTGEVYNQTKRFADDGSLLYLKLNNATQSEKDQDTTSFTN